MKDQMQAIANKIESNERISRDEAAWLFQHASDSDLSRLSTIVRRRYHADDNATYLIMAIVNYTNVCVAKCDYCSFFRLPHQTGTYLLNFEQVCERIDSLRAYGGTLVAFNGGFHPKLHLRDYAELFSRVRARYLDELEFFEMTVAEFMFSCKLSKVSYEEGALLLKGSGTRWITGGGAEILDDGFRMRHSPGKFKVSDYFSAQEAILKAGMGSTATMVIGFDETLDERMNHLDTLRTFQDRVNGKLPSFLCWTYKPWNNELGGKEISNQEYLRWLAICRIFLDNFRHIRTSVLTQNERALAGLRYGANDFDLPTEDEVTQKAGATITHDFERILSAARADGFKVQYRDPFPIF
jgi:cyclic dehypoxanthinyl futalosine synthase